MTHYAQKDYSQIQGNGTNTIAEVGTLLTAFANLLDRFGVGVDPATLNAAFIEDSLYLNKTDEIRDRLAMSSISGYDSTIGMIGMGEGEPLTHNAIVKLEYHSVLTDSVVTAFALVVDNVAGTIVDSFDGAVKSWDVYGGPVEWYAYGQFDAITVTPLKAPGAPEAVKPEMFTVAEPMDGYAYLEDKQTGTNPIHVAPGKYFVFSRDGDQINVTATVGQPGAWIVISSVVQESVPVPETLAVDTPAPDGEKVPVRVVPTDPLAWQKTYSPNLGEVAYETLNDSTVTDYAGNNAPVLVPAGSIIPVGGHFTVDGKEYARTTTSIVNGDWFGVPFTNLKRQGTVDGEDELDAQLDQYLTSEKENLRFELGDDRQSVKEKAIKAGATAQGKIEKVGKLLSFRKK